MCGRFTQTKSKQEIKKRFNVKKVPDGIENLFNIAPERDIAAILNESPDEISLVRWGLIPVWSNEVKSPFKMINARAETLLERVSYKKLIQKKRCLIISDSFFEWRETENGKIPYRIMLKSGDLFSFAGLWDLWEKEGKTVLSCSIITTVPNSLCAKIHDRMPVIIPKESEARWLSNVEANEVLPLLKAYPSEEMKYYEVSKLVNNASNNTEEVIREHHNTFKESL